MIGGGSTYTPELVEGIARRDDRLQVDELVLLDINRRAARDRWRAGRRILPRLGWQGRITITGDQDEALDGANYVCAAAHRRPAGAAVDETLPPRFGTIGQETTGAGGFAKALRTVPVILELAELAGRRAAPGAWMVDFTNPVGIITQALLDAGHRAIGLCNVAIGLQRRLAERFGVEPEHVELEHVGLNHLTWVRAVRVDGGTGCPSCSTTDTEDMAEKRRHAGRARPRCWKPCLPLTFATTTAATRSCVSSRRASTPAPRK